MCISLERMLHISSHRCCDCEHFSDSNCYQSPNNPERAPMSVLRNAGIDILLR